MNSVDLFSFPAPAKKLHNIRKGKRANSVHKNPAKESNLVCDNVEVAAFAPMSIKANTKFLVQVLLHLYDDLSSAEDLALASDGDAVRRAANTLIAPVQRGARLTVDIEVENGHVDVDRQTVAWTGRPAAVNFFVKSGRCNGDCLQMLITVSNSGVPLGQLRFVANIGKHINKKQLCGDQAIAFSKAFLSYASCDRVQVLRAAQLLRLAGLDVFQDVLVLEPGENWSTKIMEEISGCDLFLLFWSNASSKSEWVIKEAEYALACAENSESKTPCIKPVIIDGPPIPAPPRSLKKIHFNDKLQYIIAAAEAERTDSA